MKRTTVTLPDSLSLLLEQEAQRTGTSVSEIARRALAAYLGDTGEPRALPFAGLGRSGHRNTARDFERIMVEEAASGATGTDLPAKSYEPQWDFHIVTLDQNLSCAFISPDESSANEILGELSLSFPERVQKMSGTWSSFEEYRLAIDNWRRDPRVRAGQIRE